MAFLRTRRTSWWAAFDVGSGFSGLDLQMGNYIDSGDFDGDGLCDLVTASFYYRYPTEEIAMA